MQTMTRKLTERERADILAEGERFRTAIRRITRQSLLWPRS